MSPFAVIDVETTGLNPFRHDRIVELAVVLINPGVGIIEEFTTLVNPERDVGPTRIHGITASDVINAPGFREVAGSLVEILKKSQALVGHNVRFDHSFLQAEFAKIGHELPQCVLIDTLFLAGGGKLSACCARYGVQYTGRLHSALHDARATAGLLEKILSVNPDALSICEPFKHVNWPDIMMNQVCLLPRDMLDKTGHKPLIHFPANEAAVTQFIENIENETQLVEMNECWMGKTVCFTGESQCSVNGRMITRTMAESIAAEKGLIIQSYVTKKLDMLIAADPNTQSNKAKKAKQYGTRIIPELVFWRTLRVSID
jgi:DNA polymerase III epsilon subunit family exonuclease